MSDERDADEAPAVGKVAGFSLHAGVAAKTNQRDKIGKEIYMCFIDDGDMYLYPHDSVLEEIKHRISDKTWIAKGTWSTPNPTRNNRQLLEPYLL